METWIIIVLYAIIGILFQIIKNLDEKGSYVECIISGIICGVLAGFLITEHRISTLILGGVIIGLLISGRLSNVGYYFGLGSVLAMILYYGTPPITLGFLLIIAGATLTDEFLAMAESGVITNKISGLHPVINILLVAFLIFDIVPPLGVGAFIVSEVTYRLGAIVIEK
ncbi:MAG: hypothetical protein ACE5HY_04015 [Candidatus Hydrothermarchaeales archaeon]